MRIRYSFSSRRTGTIEGGNDHTTAVPAIARQVIRMSDLVLEVLDSRFIAETRNLEMEAYVKELGKKLVYVINKCDIGDDINVQNVIHTNKLAPVVLVSCRSGLGRRKLRDTIKMEVKRAKLDRQANVGVVGYPNTGKSSIINFLVGSGADTSKESGFTKGMKKLKLNEKIAIIDTPGVIGEKEAKSKTAFWAKSADQTKDPLMVLVDVMKRYPGVLEKNYNIAAEGDPEVLLEAIAQKNHFKKKGGASDLQRAARLILRDWQLNKIYNLDEPMPKS